jgi:hypothetical protein
VALYKAVGGGWALGDGAAARLGLGLTALPPSR